MARPAVTVVLPTFRRPHSLARTLQSLAEQRAPGFEWELLVVDNDEPPGIEAAVRSLTADIRAPVTLLREARRGAAFARNTGIEEASGDVVAFIDDDVVAAPTWLAALSTPILEGRSEGSGGPVNLDPAVPLPRWVSKDWRGCLSEFARRPEEHELRRGDYVLTASAAFRTELLRKTGGFDPILGPAQRVPIFYNEDVDLCRRFWAAGGRIRYVPDARVTHEVPPERLRPGYFVRRTYAQGRSDWLLDREVNVRRPLGGAKGMVIHLGHLLEDRVREGPWHPDVAMGAALSVVHFGGFLREAAARKMAFAKEQRR
jgi:GT2 family glycosyltransferase